MSYGTVFMVLSGCGGSEQCLGHILLHKCLKNALTLIDVVIETKYLIYVLRILSCNQRNFFVELLVSSKLAFGL